jgi:hypothetical protein
MRGADTAVLTAYFLTMIVVGFVYSRQMKSLGMYFAGGKQLPLWELELLSELGARHRLQPLDRDIDRNGSRVYRVHRRLAREELSAPRSRDHVVLPEPLDEDHDLPFVLEGDVDFVFRNELHLPARL